MRRTTVNTARRAPLLRDPRALAFLLLSFAVGDSSNYERFLGVFEGRSSPVLDAVRKLLR
jgi:hypothetical protein